MKKVFTVAVYVFLLFNFSIAAKLPNGGKQSNSNESSSNGLSKAEREKIKQELKGYLKNIEGYKAKVDANQAVLDSNDMQIKQLTQELATAISKQTGIEKSLNVCDSLLRVSEEEKNAIKEKTKGEDTTEEKAGEKSEQEAPADNKVSAKGVIYKVQLGVYKSLNINKYFKQPRYIGYEEVNGMNRYVIGNFNDEKTANKFLADIHRLGIKDAFVAKYIDGARVYEWNDNPKYKGRKVPNNLDDALPNDKSPDVIKRE